MKISFILIALASLLNANACDIPAAEFIGTIKNHIQVSAVCTYNIEYSYFSSSNECPLVIGEASNALFQDNDCSLKDGDKVSGILERINEQIVY